MGFFRGFMKGFFEKGEGVRSLIEGFLAGLWQVLVLGFLFHGFLIDVCVEFVVVVPPLPAINQSFNQSINHSFTSRVTKGKRCAEKELRDVRVIKLER